MTHWYLAKEGTLSWKDVNRTRLVIVHIFVLTPPMLEIAIPKPPSVVGKTTCG